MAVARIFSGKSAERAEKSFVMERGSGLTVAREAARLAFLLQCGEAMGFRLGPVVPASAIEEEKAELLAGIREGAFANPQPGDSAAEVRLEVRLDVRLEVWLEVLAHLSSGPSTSLNARNTIQ